MRPVFYTLVLIGFLFIFGFFTPAHSGKGQEHNFPPPKISNNFNLMSGLIGKWQGIKEEGGKKEKIKAEYKYSAGKTAIVETVFVGSPHEMVSVYHSDGSDVVMTHYCMLGNQPRMKLKRKNDDELFFKHYAGTNMKKKDPHMHSLKITMEGKNKMRQEWTMFEKKKPTKTVVINFTRRR